MLESIVGDTAGYTQQSRDANEENVGLSCLPAWSERNNGGDRGDGAESI